MSKSFQIAELPSILTLSKRRSKGVLDTVSVLPFTVRYFENGVVMSNFPNYETLRINQMPKINIKIVSAGARWNW